MMDTTTLFFPEAFSLSENIQIETVHTPLAKVTLIRNFYKNLEQVTQEVKKLPSVSVKGSYAYKNEDWYIDRRKSYVESMPGTELPYQDQLKDYLPRVLNVSKHQLNFNGCLLVNCFRKSANFPKDKPYYGAHTDFKLYNTPQVAIVVFLNQHYEKGEGINFYEYVNRKESNNTPFTDEEETKFLHFIQAEPNMGILLDSYYPHGQAIGGSQFFNNTRYTQVIFIGITAG